jgi:hypothetical protein
MNVIKNILGKDIKSKNNLMKNAKDTVKLGVVSGIGTGVVGMIPGGGPYAGTVGTSLGILNAGQMLKNTKSIFKK